MAGDRRFHRAYKEHDLRRSARVHESEDQQELIAQQPAVVGLQQHIGNRAVQRLLAQGRLSSHGVVQKKPEIRRCGCGGSCAACKGQAEEAVSTGMVDQVQRFWDDEEEDGGGWLDSAAEEVGGWLSGDEAESGGDSWWSGQDEGEEMVAPWTENEEESEESGESGSWLDDAADWVSEKAGAVADWASDTWNDWTGGGEEETEEEELVEHDTGGQPATPGSIPTVNADCLTEEGVGFGNGGGTISLHGQTNANYNHGRPIPAPFPDTVTVTTRTTPAGNAFDAVGTFDVTFDANTSVTLPPVPSGLTPCQEEAVRNFINGPLAAHEQDHVNAFRNNYDGTFTASVNAQNLADTPSNRQNVMNNPVNTEDVTRTTAANTASAALDPWNQTIPGLDCEDESEDSEDSE